MVPPTAQQLRPPRAGATVTWAIAPAAGPPLFPKPSGPAPARFPTWDGVRGVWVDSAGNVRPTKHKKATALQPQQPPHPGATVVQHTRPPLPQQPLAARTNLPEKKRKRSNPPQPGPGAASQSAQLIAAEAVMAVRTGVAAGLSAAAAAAQPPRISQQAVQAAGSATLKMAPFAVILQAPGSLGAASSHPFAEAFADERERMAAGELHEAAAEAEAVTVGDLTVAAACTREAECQRRSRDEQIFERSLVKGIVIPILESALHRTGTNLCCHVLTFAAVLVAIAVICTLWLIRRAEAHERGRCLFFLCEALMTHAADWWIRVLHIVWQDERAVRPVAAGVWAMLWTACHAALDLGDPASWTALWLSFATATAVALALPLDVSPALLGIAEACGGMALALWGGDAHGGLPSYDALMARAAALTLATAVAHTTALALERLLSALRRRLHRPRSLGA